MGQKQLRYSQLGSFEQLGQKSAQEKYDILKELLQAQFDQEEEKVVENMGKMNTKLTQENVEMSMEIPSENPSVKCYYQNQIKWLDSVSSACQLREDLERELDRQIDDLDLCYQIGEDSDWFLLSDENSFQDALLYAINNTLWIDIVEKGERQLFLAPLSQRLKADPEVPSTQDDFHSEIFEPEYEISFEQELQPGLDHKAYQQKNPLAEELITVKAPQPDWIEVINPNDEHQQDANVAFQPQANHISRQRCVCWNTKEQKVWLIILIVFSILLFAAILWLAFEMLTLNKHWLGATTHISYSYTDLPQFDEEQIIILETLYADQIQTYWEDKELDENMKKHQLMLLFLYLGDLAVDMGSIWFENSPDSQMIESFFTEANTRYCKALYYAYWSQEQVCPAVSILINQSTRAQIVFYGTDMACQYCFIDPYVEYGFSPFYIPTFDEIVEKEVNFWLKRIPEIQNRLRYQQWTSCFFYHKNFEFSLDIGFEYFLTWDFNMYKQNLEERNLSRIDAYITPMEFDNLFAYYDQNNDGSVQWSEFELGFVTNMSELRNYIIKNAFEYLDEQKTGKLSVDRLLRIYDASKHPKVLRGCFSSEDVRSEIDYYLPSYSKAGFLSYDQFQRYYLWVNAFIPIEEDEYFRELVQNTWGIPDVLLALEQNTEIIDALPNESKLAISNIQKDLIEDRKVEIAIEKVSGLEISASVSNNLSSVYLFIELTIFLAACIGLLFSYLWLTGKGKKKIVEPSIPYTRMQDK